MADRIRIVTLRLGMARAYLVRQGAASILVDSGYPGNKLAESLDKAGIGVRDLGLALITHAHVDHFGGLASLKALSPGLAIAVGEADAASLAEGRNADLKPYGRMGRFAALFSRGDVASPSQAATILFRGGENLSPYGLQAEIIATPGHTRGSLSLFLAEACDEGGREVGPAAIVGDLVMGGFVFSASPKPPLLRLGHRGAQGLPRKAPKARRHPPLYGTRRPPRRGESISEIRTLRILRRPTKA